MSENDAETPSPPENERKQNGQFKKGLSPNPKGRPKGALAKKTKFLQIMTRGRQQKALQVLDKEIALAASGDKDARKNVLTLLQPFLKREAEKDSPGGGDKRPVVTVVVNQTDGKVIPAARVIEAK